ncbi:hypothetical protein HYT53_06005 [Candidatus Woesearchaeota archaeon]|nr:hypothetical protein [Candidatus Woesearchaeota archaeon]
MNSSKKGDILGRKMVFYVIAIFVIVAAFFVVTPAIASDKSKISELPEGLENYFLIQRFLNAPSCFALQDRDTGRTFPMTIDIEKFNEANLNKCYNAQDTSVKAYRLTLKYGNVEKSLSTKNWQGFFRKAETKRVFAYDNGNVQKAELIIETQNAK